MDLNTIEQIVCPKDRASLPRPLPGDAFLGGGTWLFSEPQPALRRLIDLSCLNWPPLAARENGWDISATCTLAELEAFASASPLPAARLVVQCCQALLGSFKIRQVATVGGNLCLALAASPMAALFAALGGLCTIWTEDGGERLCMATDFIRAAGQNALRPGEILRSVLIAGTMLDLRTSFRKMSLTEGGRSAALLIGLESPKGLVLTISASVARPVRFLLPWGLAPADLGRRIDAAITEWYDDVHGAPAWRRHITHHLAREIYAEFRG